MSHFSGRRSWAPFLHFLAYLSPFAFPFYLLRFRLFSIPFTALEFFCYFFFAVFLMAVFLRKENLHWQKPARHYYLFAFLLLVGSSVGALTSPHYITLPSGVLQDSLQVALGVWKGWVLAPMLYFFAFTQVVRDPMTLKKVLRYFVISAALVALSAYVLAIFGNGFTYDLRLSGFFESANYLALYLGPALLLGIYFFVSEKERKGAAGILNLASLTILAHALVLSQSYAAILALFGSLVFYVLINFIRHRMNVFKISLIFLILLVSFAMLVVSQRDSEKFKQFTDFENRSSSTVRLEIYDISWNLIRRYPVTGVGPGLFQSYYQTQGPEILERAPMEWNIPHPHNLFLAFYLNAGILGFVALLGLLFLAHTSLTYPLLALWGIVLHGFFDTPFWKNDLAMIFWLILGAIVILQTYGSTPLKNRSNPIRRRTTPRHSTSLQAKKFTA